MAKTSPQSTASLFLYVSAGSDFFQADGRESTVLDLYAKWLTRNANEQLREMTAQLQQSADALQQAMTRATEET